MLALLLSTFWVGMRAQNQSPCDLMLIPEEDQMCILEKHANSYYYVQACRGNTVAYRAYSPTALRYEWEVEGGSDSVSSDSTVCYVTWGDGDYGYVMVTVLRDDSSSCQGWVQVRLIDKPVIGLISSPNYMVNPDNPTEKWIEVCMYDTITLTDNSSNGDLPVADYYWESPYGISNGRSFSFVALTPGETYDIVHRAYNDCGCYDEERIKIIVNDECPFKVSCYGATCAGNEGVYTVEEPSFSQYYWSVEGGELIQPYNSRTVRVLWGAPESGFGTLYLDGTYSDCACKSRKAIRVPVLSNQVPINGPDTLCVGADFAEYTLPLWGGTEYSWTVSSTTGLSLTERVNIARVTPLQPGTYTLTATFHCDFIGCGSYEVEKTIVVKNMLEITPSAEEVCVGSAVDFTTNATTPCLWAVERDGQTLYTENATLFSYSFDTVGMFTVYAYNSNFCKRAMTSIRVKDRPPQPRNVKGPRVVCPNSAETYTATKTGNEYYLLWRWSVDGTERSCIGDEANITFGNTVSDIRVSQVNIMTGCESDPVEYHISPFQLAPFPYTTLKLCPEQVVTLNQLADQSANGVTYEWTVIPSNVISIQGSEMEAKVKLLANHADADDVKIVLRRTSCSGERRDTINVFYNEVEAPDIIHGDICVGRNTTFSVPNVNDADLENTYWYLDNQVLDKHYGGSVSFSFYDTESHEVHLYYVTKGGCHVSTSIIINAAPCPYTPPDPGCPLYPGACQIVQHCFNTISVENLLPASGLTYPLKLVVSQNNRVIYWTMVHAANQRILIPKTGDCSFSIRWESNDQCYYYVQSLTMNGPLPTFTIANNCDGRLRINAPMRTRVEVLRTPPNDVPISIQPLMSGTCLLGPIYFSLRTGNYYLRLNYPSLAREFCYIDTLVHFESSILTVNSIDAESMMCEKTAYVFTANAIGRDDLTYEWDFGDGSSNKGNNIEHVYDFERTPIFPQPVIPGCRRTVTVTVTDRYGCTATSTTSVRIFPDDAQSYTLNADIPQCPGTPAVLSTQSNAGTTYDWRPYSTSQVDTAQFSRSGTYGVAITTARGCRTKLTRNVAYPNAPFAYISCDKFYCKGDQAKLYTYVNQDYSYTWEIELPDGTPETYTAPTPLLTLTQHGVYNVTLTVSDGNCSAVATDSFTVHEKPVTPTLEICGNPCITEGPVEVCNTDGRDLYWSNGTRGDHAFYFYDGLNTAYYVDPVTGCKSDNAVIDIPEAPKFDGFLSGCYRFCDKNIPGQTQVFTLGDNLNTYGLHWLYNGEEIDFTTLPPSPADLPIPGDGQYQLVVDYSDDCNAASPLLTIEGVDCGNPGTEPGVIPPLVGSVTSVECVVEGCKAYYMLNVDICNISDEPFGVDKVTSPNSGVDDSSLPVFLNPGECITVDVKVLISSINPASILLTFYEGEERLIGSVSYSYYEWFKCLQLDNCQTDIVPYLEKIDGEMNQSTFFAFQLGLPNNVSEVLSVWTDCGQIYDGMLSGSIYFGLLYLDNGLVSQLAAAGGSLCLHAICCVDDRLCLTEICIPFSDIWHSIESGEPYGRQPEQTGEPKSAQKLSQQLQDNTLALEPNPATGVVSVCDAMSHSMVDNVVLVEVFSMQGRKMLSLSGVSRIDVSDLPSGSYIVKVLTDDMDCTYLKLIKK